MAKKKQKKGEGAKARAKAAQDKGARLPKRIAGVKVPKQLREPGGKLLEAVTHPLVMDIAAAALMAAAARMRDEASKSAASRQGGDSPRPAGPDVGAVLAATAAEGIRRIADAALGGGKSGGSNASGGASKGAAGGNGRAGQGASQSKDSGGS